MDMKERILDIAQRLIQQRGVNGFSYADIAKEVGVSKPSLHHHFATKTDLVSRLMERYTEQLKAYLETVSASDQPALEKLRRYCALYESSLDSQRMCMGGMLSAEAITLDPKMLPLLQTFFVYQRDWLTLLLESGRAAKELTIGTTAEAEACTIMAAMQGALMVSRSASDNVFFHRTVQGLFDQLSNP